MGVKKRYVLATSAAVLLTLTSCSDPVTSESTDSSSAQVSDTPAHASFLANHDLAGMDGTEIIEHLDQLAVHERPTDLMASVRPDELILMDPNEEVALDLPEDSFYLSFAPFINQTHDCYYHSLTTCQGELANQEIDVRIVDDAGEVIVDEQITTYDNGFVGFWIPDNVEGTVEVTLDGLTGEVPFSSTDEGATCLTTLQLA